MNIYIAYTKHIKKTQLHRIAQNYSKILYTNQQLHINLQFKLKFALQVRIYCHTFNGV